MTMTNFILTDRKTDYLLPTSIDEWLTDDHLARFVVEIIDGLDLLSAGIRRRVPLARSGFWRLARTQNPVLSN